MSWFPEMDGPMFIHDPPKPQTRKELKVNLPTHQHRSLRQLTVVTGLETPALVSQALNLYFQKLAREAAESQSGRN